MQGSLVTADTEILSSDNCLYKLADLFAISLFY